MTSEEQPPPNTPTTSKSAEALRDGLEGALQASGLRLAKDLEVHVRRSVRSATRTRVKASLFALGVLLSLGFSTFICSLWQPPLPVAVFLVYLPLMVVCGLLAERLPVSDIFSSQEELNLERTEFLHKQIIREIEANGERLRAAGVDEAEVTAKLHADYNRETDDYKRRLRALQPTAARGRGSSAPPPAP